MRRSDQFTRLGAQLRTSTSSSISQSSPTPTPTPTPSASATSTSSTTNTSASPTATADPDPNTLSTGAIAGIAIGAVVGTAAIALLAYLAWVMKRRNKAQPSPYAYESAPEYVYAPANPGYPPTSELPHSPAKTVYGDRGQYARAPAELHGSGYASEMR
ncbi:hypothetical protein BU23DRAFT_596307 [Bimuria novae-zelandiae CBS 107.79]|uniref:Mid2 domain-containing protein n=1 Tax=Bimuria novae-zelandiae CBS 107.79 TaxID=1447943 RepID=A0A6A5VLM6_9PLEO|nr:hypothetical protein BU23DRAFT_596307 [Bimuria novae-zelandiae CBS 107.79]